MEAEKSCGGRLATSPDTTDTKDVRPVVPVLAGAHSLLDMGCFSCRIEARGRVCCSLNRFSTLSLATFRKEPLLTLSFPLILFGCFVGFFSNFAVL